MAKKRGNKRAIFVRVLLKSEKHSIYVTLVGTYYLYEIVVVKRGIILVDPRSIVPTLLRLGSPVCRFESYIAMR